MRAWRGSFWFMGAFSVVLSVVAIVVAHNYHLPVRDPAGVALPTYFQLPIFLLVAFVTDVLPRALFRARGLRGLAGTVRSVVTERWRWPHARFALVGLGAWYLTYAAFRNLKSYVPFVNRHIWDDTLHRLDRTLWLGHDPATVLHHVFGTGWAAQFFSTVYVVWIALVPVSLVVALVWSRDVKGGEWYVTAVAVDWVLGVATYFALPTLGPIYSRPQEFSTLPHTYVTTLQTTMIDDRHAVLAGPWATHAVQTIAAFASLHVALMVTVCLMVELLRLCRSVRWSMWVFLALTEVATIYLGWHFFIDTVAGAVLGAAGVWIAAIGTGNKMRRRPAAATATAVLVSEPIS
ncbi:MAG: phosphatase PAP2 family protein [Nocardioidaceae bacterium]